MRRTLKLLAMTLAVLAVAAVSFADVFALVLVTTQSSRTARCDVVAVGSSSQVSQAEVDVAVKNLSTGDVLDEVSSVQLLLHETASVVVDLYQVIPRPPPNTLIGCKVEADSESSGGTPLADVAATLTMITPYRTVEAQVNDATKHQQAIVICNNPCDEACGGGN